MNVKKPMTTKDYYERKHTGMEFSPGPGALTLKKGPKVRLVEWLTKKAGKKTGKKLKTYMEGKDMGTPSNGDKFAVTTNLRSTGKIAAIPLVVMFVFNALESFRPGATEGINATELQNQIVGAVNFALGASAIIGALWGSVSNIWKNWHRVQNGVTLTK